MIESMHEQTRHHRMSGGLLALLVAALALIGAACGSDDPDLDTAVSDETAQPADETDVEPPTDAEPTAVEADGNHDDAVEADENHDDAVEADENHDDAVEADEVIEITMSEFAYEPDTVTVVAGSTVRFVFVNEGVIEHEAIIGDRHLQDEQAAETASGEADGDHGHHGDVPVIVLGAGESGELTVTFDEAGELMIGCHIPGHWDAGMSGIIEVV